MDEQNVSAPEADQEVVAHAENETDAPEAVENTQGQDNPQPAEDEGKDPDAEDKPSASKLRRERRKAEKERVSKALADAEAEAEREKARADKLEQTMQSSKVPQEADFDTYEQYQAALSGYYSVRQLDERNKAEATQSHEASQQKLEAARIARKAELAQNWQQQAAEAKAKYPDFQEVVQGERTPLSDLMQEMVMDSDVGAEIAYQLAKNPDEALAIASLSPLEQARRMGQIEANMSRAAPSKATKAPEPMTPVGSKGGSTADPTKMTPDQYRAYRQAGGKI